MDKLHFKTELADGELHIPPEGFLEHKFREQQHKQRAELAKLANNPILSGEVRHTIGKAIVDSNMMEYWRTQYIKLKEQYEKEKKK